MNANRAGACLLLVLVLPIWNLGVTKWQHAHNPVPGNFYSVDGRQMHLHCSGAGLPSIVIEAGASADWLGWQGVQPKLSHLTRVCTYDRAGMVGASLALVRGMQGLCGHKSRRN